MLSIMIYQMILNLTSIELVEQEEWGALDKHGHLYQNKI